MSDQSSDKVERPLTEDTDALRWARELSKRFPMIWQECGALTIEDTEGTMLSWFANAIETGRRAGRLEVRSAALPRIPDGWKLVPIEPTPEMLNEMDWRSKDILRLSKERYANMLAAAPPVAPSSERTRTYPDGWREGKVEDQRPVQPAQAVRGQKPLRSGTNETSRVSELVQQLKREQADIRTAMDAFYDLSEKLEDDLSEKVANEQAYERVLGAKSYLEVAGELAEARANVERLEVYIARALVAMDEAERAGGDAPHRVVDLATRIKVICTPPSATAPRTDGAFMHNDMCDSVSGVGPCNCPNGRRAILDSTKGQK